MQQINQPMMPLLHSNQSNQNMVADQSIAQMIASDQNQLQNGKLKLQHAYKI